MQNKKWFKIFIWLMLIAMVGSVFLGLLEIFV
ncbi:stressosome-associated protein Prli42 [Saccharibacillus alkalitolerans]|uniref:Stressosome-associated protein Prli42 n=1 Tax=Saccharibacillus alkalitolerans TaxID=2705290 RepID=A0ABX0F159_9BACL|nr:stressosome-associated protein Prli42 [Saccharibacillus alkalitolerans]NGZ74200.1 stressosome-associated protein Prli42 [Saccharibacillus alkalitolerans]